MEMEGFVMKWAWTVMLFCLALLVASSWSRANSAEYNPSRPLLEAQNAFECSQPACSNGSCSSGRPAASAARASRRFVERARVTRAIVRKRAVWR